MRSSDAGMAPVVAPCVLRPPELSASAGGRSDHKTAARRPTTDRVCAPAGGGGKDVTHLWRRARTAYAASRVARRAQRYFAIIGGKDMCPALALRVQWLPAPTARAGGRRFRDAFDRQPHGDAVDGVAGEDMFRPGGAVAREEGGDGPGLSAMAGFGKWTGPTRNERRSPCCTHTSDSCHT